MLFNSFVFLFQFLPPVLAGTFLLAGWRTAAAKTWLLFASLFFYSWWHAPHLFVIVSVMLFTYLVGQGMLHAVSPASRRGLLIVGLLADLSVLGYFKYFNFFAGSLNSWVGSSFRLDPILLPLAISFFTFQKVAFLMDVYQGKIRKCPFLDYCLFVAFFPQLIAGPIVHYREIAPQFLKGGVFRFRASHLSVGLSMLIFGLFKKVIVADSLAPLATSLFAVAAAGKVPTAMDAWTGSAAYSLQLYFDFSGYSDMAIGLARMFGILLPLNFNSPYKSASIVDFWRRWHITLSNFLRDYVYFPLGGSRCGKPRQFLNLVATMFIGGLWHGAGWTFVIWGLMHGAFLAVNHAWQKCPASRWGEKWLAIPAGMLTMLCVHVAWVFFRAATIADAWRVVTGMFHAKRFALKIFEGGDVALVAGILLAALLLPNTQQILASFKPAFNYRCNNDCGRAPWLWAPNFRWACLLGLMIGICICCMARPSQFLYFQF